MHTNNNSYFSADYLSADFASRTKNQKSLSRFFKALANCIKALCLFIKKLFNL